MKRGWRSLVILASVLSNSAGYGQTALKTSPGLYSFQEGTKLFKLRDYHGAIVKFDQAIKSDSKLAPAYYSRACCKHLLKDYQGCREDCTSSIRIDGSGNAMAYFQRAVAEYRLNQLDECINDCNSALRLAPDFPHSMIYRAHAKEKKGDKRGALEDCNNYLKFYPEDSQAQRFKKRLTLHNK